jgi:hypothetical protein
LPLPPALTRASVPSETTETTPPATPIHTARLPLCIRTAGYPRGNVLAGYDGDPQDTPYLPKCTLFVAGTRVCLYLPTGGHTLSTDGCRPLVHFSVQCPMTCSWRISASGKCGCNDQRAMEEKERGCNDRRHCGFVWLQCSWSTVPWVQEYACSNRGVVRTPLMLSWRRHLHAMQPSTLTSLEFTSCGGRCLLGTSPRPAENSLAAQSDFYPPLTSGREMKAASRSRSEFSHGGSRHERSRATPEISHLLGPSTTEGQTALWPIFGLQSNCCVTGWAN